MPDVQVKIGTRLLTGFTSARITAALSAAAATVSLSGASFAARTFNGEEPLEVLTDGVTVFAGVLDSVQLEIGPAGSRFTLTGRTQTADLVDSTVDREVVAAELAGLDIVELVQTYRKALGVPVAVRTQRLRRPLPIVEKFAGVPGETYWNAIERACRKVGVIATSGQFGNLQLITPGNYPRVPVGLRQGENVLAARSSTNWADRTRTVIAEGQGSAFSSAWEQQLRVRGFATDNAVRPSRVRVLQVEGSPTPEDCRLRAAWEAQHRAARGTRIAVKVAGWLVEGTTDPWRQGTLVGCAIPDIRVSGFFLIDSVSHEWSDQGLVTQLELVRRDAYDIAPTIEPGDEPSWDLLGGGE